MRIVDVRATPVYVPMRHPLRWSFGVEPGMNRVIVEIDREQLDRYHRLYVERGDRDEFQDEARTGWRPHLPLW